MAGRNWTRKSIEELVREYLKKHAKVKTEKKGFILTPYVNNFIYEIYTDLRRGVTYTPNIGDFEICNTGAVHYYKTIFVNNSIGLTLQTTLNTKPIGPYTGNALNLPNPFLHYVYYVPNGSNPRITVYNNPNGKYVRVLMRNVQYSDGNGKTLNIPICHFEGYFGDEVPDENNMLVALLSKTPVDYSAGNFILTSYEITESDFSVQYPNCTFAYKDL